MHRSFFARALSALALLASTAVMAGGLIEVSFKPLDQLTDVGRGREAERSVQSLAEHFKSLASRLPDGQTLKVEVLDVNLAGELRPDRRGGEVRVMKGGADWPALDLRWTLSGGGRALASGEDHLADMAYLTHTPRALHDTVLPYETRLIDRWFSERIGTAAAR